MTAGDRLAGALGGFVLGVVIFSLGDAVTIGNPVRWMGYSPAWFWVLALSVTGGFLAICSITQRKGVSHGIYGAPSG